MSVKKKLHWLWLVLFALYLLTVSANVSAFFHPDSAAKLYYRILIGFNNIFLIPYLLSVLVLILDVLALVPFYNYLDPVRNTVGAKVISAQGWKWFFAVRFALAFVGHPYDLKQLQAIFRNDVWAGLAVLNILFVFYGPSHFAAFFYAYNRQKISHSCK